MFYDTRFALPHLASLVLSCLLLLSAIRNARLGRFLLLMLFAWACAANSAIVIQNPRVYLDYAPLAVLKIYRDIILGPFAHHVRLFVLLIALGQALIALGLALGNVWARLALVGALIFLVDIAPLGVGSAFPSTLVLAGAAGVLLTASRSGALAGPVWGVLRHPFRRAAP